MQEEQVRRQEEGPGEEQVNVIGLLKDKEEFRRTFDRLEKVAYQRIKAQQFEAAIECLNKCQDMLQVISHSDSQFSSQLGANLLSHITFAKPVIYLNLAAAYQGAWKIQKCSKFCHLADLQLSSLIKMANFSQCRQTGAADSQQRQLYLKACRYLVTLKFQHCAILSQLNSHDKALQTCKAGLPLLRRQVQVLSQYIGGGESTDKNTTQHGVAFRGRVSGLARRILGNLTVQLSDSVGVEQSRSSSLYFWERNPEKNEDQLLRIFLKERENNDAKRSILGVNKQHQWIDHFNIGSIMRMSPITTTQLSKAMPIEEYFFKDRLFELAIHCSLAYFTIATEMRFIDSQQSGLQAPNSNSTESGSEYEQRMQNIKRKYGYEEKSSMFKLSQAYHLRAIEVVSVNIQAPIPYLTHMIKSYDKHYVFRKQLEQIAALGDESCVEPSMMNQFSVLRQPHSALKSHIQEQKEMPLQEPVKREQTDSQPYDDYLDQKQKEKAQKPEDIHRASEELQKYPRNTVRIVNSQAETKGRTKSAGKIRKTHKTGKEQISYPTNKKVNHDKGKQLIRAKKSKGQFQREGEMQVRTKSSTSIRLVFKRKK